MKAVIYARVSSKEQEETGYSLPAQEKLLQEYAQKREFSVAKKFSISESASGQHQRKTFGEMLGYIRKNKANIIVCEKVDRLTRNIKDAVLVNEWLNEDPQRQVHFVKENTILTKDSKSNEKFIWNIKVSVSQYYIDNLSEEVKKGQKEKIAQGWLPTKPPLGYKTVGEKGHKVHIIDEDKAPLIKKMFELYASGNYSLKRLLQIMHAEGLRMQSGNKLVKSRLATLLSDPFYVGKLRWNEEIFQGQHEPMISKELFDAVQNALHGKTTPRYGKHSYLFKGLIRCQECQGTITWETHKGITYGHCNYWYKSCSQKTWVKEPKIEEQTIEPLEKLQIRDSSFAERVRKALKENHQDEMQYHNTTLENLNASLERIQKRLDAIYEDKLDGKIDNAFYERKFHAYTQEKEQIVDSVQRHSNANTKYFELGMSIYDLSQKAKEIYVKAKPDEKRQLMSLVFQSLSLNEGKLISKYTKPFEVLAQAVEATNSSKVAILEKTGQEILEPAILGLNKAKSATVGDGFRSLLRR